MEWDALLVTQQRWLTGVACVNQHWEVSMAPLASHMPFAPWSHIGQQRHLSANCRDGRGAKHCCQVRRGLTAILEKCLSFSSGQTRSSLVIFGLLSKMQAGQGLRCRVPPASPPDHHPPPPPPSLSMPCATDATLPCQ